MLGRLIQTAASYSKGTAALESATEEAHTRNLLYGQSHHVYSLAQSPPTSPFASSAFRPGTFDDRGGLELEERDLRILVAQDAFGAEEKPMLLFDSHTVQGPVQSQAAHSRHASTNQLGPRSPLPADWRAVLGNNPGRASPELPFRNRSSTISGSASSWARPVRDVGTREDAFLECMFGVTSSTKAASTTKMHLMPGKQAGAPSESRTHGPADNKDPSSRRAPLARARTSHVVPRSQQPNLPSLDTEALSHDAVLITRLFNVTLPESVAATAHANAGATADGSQEVPPASPDAAVSPSQSSKRPKLVERKVPAFAIGLILYLPPTSDPRPAPTRPTSRSAHMHGLSSASSSYGSDMQGSWTFLNAIPESLASSRSLNEEADRRVELIVNNWDVILRAISSLEREATVVLHRQLQHILNQVIGPVAKTPKEKSMQRINQRIISISDASTIAHQSSLQTAARHLIRRVCYALRIPRVVTGLGFAGGHWSDEARILHRLCGSRQQNFFLFNLLTAFLGTHTQWVQRLAPDCYRKQSRMSNKRGQDSHSLTQRTIIISDHRAIARRLIFILASFLPGLPGMDGLQKVGEDVLMPIYLSASSPSSHMVRNESLRRTANRRVRDNRLQSNTGDKTMLSTSASSTESALLPSKDRPYRYLSRKDSDAMSIKAPTMLPLTDADGQIRTASIGTMSAATHHPATPVAYFSSRRDSYFLEGAIAETNESVASADLAKILRRSSSSFGNSSNVSSRWGSLMSGISELWSNKAPLSADVSSTTTASPASVNANRRLTDSKPLSPSKMTELVNDADLDSKQNEVNVFEQDMTSSPGAQKNAMPEVQSPSKSLAATPRLSVDDKDGVIDVDLDLPNFMKFQLDGPMVSPAKRSHRPSMAGGHDGGESIFSLRSLPASSPRAPVAEESNVAGFLRKHHEDFMLHAVRPYPELESEVRRSMSMEPSPPPDPLGLDDTMAPDGWISVCSTLIADVRTFSIRRITLKRRLGTRDPAVSAMHESHRPSRRPVGEQVEEQFSEEEVKDFDAVLIDAVEKVLHVAEAVATPQSRPINRGGHTRTASTNTTATTKSVTPGGASAEASSYMQASRDHVRQDCRQLVLGALEEIVKDVSEEISKAQKGRAIRMSTDSNGSWGRDMKQENVLREGVKRWLLVTDHARVG